MECQTGKVVYRSERAAGDALANLHAGRRHDDPRRGERRWYHCAHCYGWHLTSQPDPLLPHSSNA